ncbi:MAG: hypothetical protein AAFU41_07890 [Pseudomonadota bacterium]
MKATLIASVIAALILFANSVGGRVEGYFFPVVAPAELDQITAVGETRSRIWGRAARLRQCSFDRVVWFLGDARNHARADVDFEESTKVRPVGAFSFGPWLVQLTPVQLRNRSYAVAFHRCHPFWLTQTRFY